jgi:ABC-type Na+ efflux pump permease subunit
MRWLLRKDIAVLVRSRFVIALLVLYPVAIALLIGFALSRGPARPRVAIVDETPPGETIKLGNQRIAVDKYVGQLLDQVQPVPVASREQAVQKVKSGDAIAALVIPPDLAARLSSNENQAQLEVLYNGNALEQSLARSAIESALAKANQGFSEQVQTAARKVINTLLAGGKLGNIGGPEEVVGLNQIAPTLGSVAARLPPSPERRKLEHIGGFADFASENLTLASRVLSTIGQPIQVNTTLVAGRRTPLDTFAAVVAVSLSLMFISVLMAAGGIAYEREEHAIARLIRGPPASPALLSRGTLLTEKALLAGASGFAIAFAMLAGVGAFVELDWGRLGQWLAALVFAAAAFGALGVAIGALAREVRAASLLAFLITLPLVFLALVPSGAVAPGYSAVIDAISFVFPFKAALQALDTAVNGAAPALGLSLLHLAVLTAVFGALARLGLRNVE